MTRNYVSECGLVVFHAKSDTTNNHRKLSNDMSCRSHLSRDSNNFEKFRKTFSVSRKILSKLLNLCLISSEHIERTGKTLSFTWIKFAIWDFLRQIRYQKFLMFFKVQKLSARNWKKISKTRLICFSIFFLFSTYVPHKLFTIVPGNMPNHSF